MSDRLEYNQADNIPQYDKEILSQPPQVAIFPNTEAPIGDTVHVHFFEDDDCDPLAVFATHQQWQLCHSIVDTNLGKTKLNNIIEWLLIVPNANANNPN